MTGIRSVEQSGKYLGAKLKYSSGGRTDMTFVFCLFAWRCVFVGFRPVMPRQLVFETLDGGKAGCCWMSGVAWDADGAHVFCM